MSVKMTSSTLTEEDMETIQDAIELIAEHEKVEAAIRALHLIGPWHEPWDGYNGRNRNGYDHTGCTHCEVDGNCETLDILDGTGA